MPICDSVIAPWTHFEYSSIHVRCRSRHGKCVLRGIEREVTLHSAVRASIFHRRGSLCRSDRACRVRTDVHLASVASRPKSDNIGACSRFRDVGVDRIVPLPGAVDRKTADTTHRRLGTFGVGLAALIVLLGVPTLIHSAARQAHCVECSPFRWRLVAFDGLALFVFSCLVSAAILLRRRADYHKRLMLLATLSLLGPAFGRLTAIANGMGDDSDVGVLVLCAGIVVVCATVDTVKSHRLHPAFLSGGVAIICMDGATYLAKMMI